MPLISARVARISDKSNKKAMQDLRNATVDELLGTASCVVEDLTKTSKVFEPHIEEKIPRFQKKELSVGRIIGRGGFCVVREVDKIRPLVTDASPKSKRGLMSRFISRKDDDCLDPTAPVNSSGMKGAKYSREYIASRSKKKGRFRGAGRYVVKAVSTDLGKIDFMKGHVDMALEAKFLSALDHPNIIELAAVSVTGACHPEYFLILERMALTLTQRIKEWMDRDRLTSGINGIFTGGKKKVQKLYSDRITASYDIACALYYLHTNNIIFRDLVSLLFALFLSELLESDAALLTYHLVRLQQKPDNIGFATTGVLKLYDFGLAKELLDSDRMDDGLYKNLTGMTGAIRYMAPEVGLGKPYNHYCDVYSWSMVTWFILALEPPFGFFTEDMILKRVLEKGTRPTIIKRWNKMIGDLLMAAWASNIKNRPSFLEITLNLKQELIDCDSTVVAASSDANSSINEGESVIQKEQAKVN